MAKMCNTRQFEQKERFYKCMEEAGYNTVEQLANQVVAHKILWEEIGIPIFSKQIHALVDGKRALLIDGQFCDLAQQVATLLNVSAEYLFEFLLPDLKNYHLDNDAESIRPHIMNDPALLLLQRDIVRAIEWLNPDELDLYIQIKVIGYSMSEVASNLNLKECGSTFNMIVKAVKKVEALFERMQTKASVPVINQNDIISSPTFLYPLPNDFRPLSLAIDIIFESKRVQNILGCDGLTHDSKINFRQAFIQALKRVDEKLSYVTPSGYALLQCRGFEITQLLGVFAEHQLQPSAAFLNACLSSKRIICDDPLKWSYIRDFHEAVRVLYRLDANSDSQGTKHLSKYEMMLNFE